jgi:hypothetical protein
MKMSRLSEPQPLAVLRQAEGCGPVPEIWRRHGMSMQAELLKEALERQSHGRINAESVTSNASACPSATGWPGTLKHCVCLPNLRGQRDLLSLPHRAFLAPSGTTRSTSTLSKAQRRHCNLPRNCHRPTITNVYVQPGWPKEGPTR